MYDYSKLIGKISEKHLTREALASRIGITDGALRDKLKGRTQFKQNEIGTSWRPKYDYMLFKKTIDTEYNAVRQPVND